MESKEQKPSEGPLSQASYKSEQEVLTHFSPQAQRILQTLFNKLATDIRRGTEESMKGLESRLDKIEDKVDGVIKRVDSIETRLDKIEGKVDGVIKRVDSIETRNQRREQLQDQRFQQLFSGFAERKSELDQALTKIAEDVHELRFTVDQVGHQIAAKFEENLKRIDRDILRLQNSAHQFLTQLLRLQREVPQSDRNYGRELTEARLHIEGLESELVKVKEKLLSVKENKEVEQKTKSEKPKPQREE